MAEPARTIESNEQGNLGSDQQDRFLTFALAGEEYGIAIEFVTEIVGLQKITKVPDLPSFIKGVINLRGSVIPVMDMRSRFDLPAEAYNERTCIIVVDVSDKAVGLVVDKVNDVVDIPAGQISPPPRSRGESYVRGLGKLGDSVKILLDVNCLLGCAEEALNETFAEA